jgi:hypothetical protein
MHSNSEGPLRLVSLYIIRSLTNIRRMYQSDTYTELHKKTVKNN